MTGAVTEKGNPLLFPSKTQPALVGNAQTLSFVDEDDQPGYIGGTLLWNPAADESRVTGYVVYTLDERNHKLRRVGRAPKSKDTYQFKIDHLQVSASTVKLGVFALNGNSESSQPVTTRLWDLPRYMAKHVFFDDQNDQQGVIGGVVFWDAADSEQGIAGYDAFLIGDDIPPTWLGSAEKGQPYRVDFRDAKIPDGAYKIVVLPRSLEGDFVATDWYPFYFVDQLPWFDDTRRPQVDLPAPTNVQFEDVGRANDDIMEISGRLMWTPPADESGQIQTYRLYFEDEEGQRVTTIGEISAKVPYVNLYRLWTSSFGSRIAIYANSKEGEAKVAGRVFVWDRPLYLQEGAGYPFVDLDPATGKIGGTLRIQTMHAWAYGVRSYNFSFVSTDGTPVLIGEVPIHDNEHECLLEIPNGTPIPPGTQEIAITPINPDGEWGPEYTTVKLIDLKENGTLPLIDQKVKVVNNYGRADTVTLYGLQEGDEVRVYRDEPSSRSLGSSTVAKGGTSVTVSVPQLGTYSSWIWLSLRGKGRTESPRTNVSLPEQLSPPPAAVAVRNVTVTNNPVGQPDLVEVRNLSGWYTVKVYGSATGEDLLGQADVDVQNGSASISINQLGVKNSNVYVTLTGVYTTESTRTAVSYSGEPSDPLQPGQVGVKNLIGNTSDQLVVTNLATGDVVKVYADKTSTTASAVSSAVGTGKTSVTVSLNALRLNSAGGDVWLSVTKAGQLESARVKADYLHEPPAALLSSAIQAVNNMEGTPDTVKVTGLREGDVVKVYSSQLKYLGESAPVATGETSATASISQLGKLGGSIRVTVFRKDVESDFTSRTFGVEQSAPLAANNVKVTNNVTASDTIVVSDLALGDTIVVYNSQTGKSLASGTVSSSSGGIARAESLSRSSAATNPRARKQKKPSRQNRTKYNKNK